MSTLQTKFEDSEKNGTITLYANPFNNGSKYYGRFDRTTVNTNTLIARIQNKKAGTNELALQQAAGFLKEEILAAIRSGEAVNVMDLGILFITANGKFNGTVLLPNEKPLLSVKFTPSQLVQSAVENIQIKEVKFSTQAPVIAKITDQFTGSTEGVLSAEKSVLLEGTRLKVSGEGSGIFLCPLDEDGNIINDKDTWCECSVITRNTQKYLEFYLPNDATPEVPYKILIRTYNSGNGSSKTIKESYSSTITIKKQSGFRY
ncbi:MAG: DUF4469 domain-containing protein [Treponema sp.]|nr:DUF4469 domain-containing protein [Candidatus Treponema equifaecale]